MVELFLIVIEVERLRAGLVLLVAEEHIIGPVWLLDVDKIVNQAAKDKEEDNSLGWEGRLEKSSGIRASSIYTS
jgi:hypothetical protein